jgi:maltooligosyltrehalose synthase
MVSISYQGEVMNIPGNPHGGRNLSSIRSIQRVFMTATMMGSATFAASSKLPYLKTLGITVIWVSPFYRSPMADNGYDIADYFAVNPDFGSMQDVDELIARSGEMGIKVMIDLVVNHTSDEHAGFSRRWRILSPLSRLLHL